MAPLLRQGEEQNVEGIVDFQRKISGSVEEDKCGRRNWI